MKNGGKCNRKREKGMGEKIQTAATAVNLQVGQPACLQKIT